MATWTLVLDGPNGDSLADIRAAAHLTFTRNRFAQVTFTLDLEDDASHALIGALRGGLPRLRCYRDQVLRFNGWWAPTEEDSTDDTDEPTAELHAIFRSPFATLASRYTAPKVQFAATDAGAIAMALLTTANTASPTGLAVGDVATTKTRARTYENKQVAEAIIELSEVVGGFDFTEEFLDTGAALAELDIVAHVGGDNTDAVFEHGPNTLGNVGHVTRRWLPPVNRARVLGENGLFGEKSDATSIGVYGEWWPSSIPTASGVVEQATLDDKAEALLRPAPMEIVEFQPDPGLAPQPWEDYDPVGDTVPVRARLGALSFQGEVRLNGIEIQLDVEGNEAAHVLTFEQPTGDVT